MANCASLRSGKGLCGDGMRGEGVLTFSNRMPRLNRPSTSQCADLAQVTGGVVHAAAGPTQGVPQVGSPQLHSLLPQASPLPQGLLPPHATPACAAGSHRRLQVCRQHESDAQLNEHNAGCKLSATATAFAVLYMTSRASAISSTSAAAHGGASPPHQAVVQLLMPVLVMLAVQLMARMRQAMLQLGLL